MRRRSTPRRPSRDQIWALLAFSLGIACSAPDEPQRAVESPAAATAKVVVAGETFEVAVAADPMTRRRGLGGRTSIPRNGGMLFVLPRPRRFSMVMRDCPLPIDVAFVDDPALAAEASVTIPDDRIWCDRMAAGAHYPITLVLRGH